VGKVIPENWKLKQLEEQIRHEREMRVLQGSRIDTHQDWLTGVNATLDVVATRLDVVGSRLEELSASQLRTEEMLQNLIQVLTREHTNGKGEK
jgi:hypothetical protein